MLTVATTQAAFDAHDLIRETIGSDRPAKSTVPAAMPVRIRNARFHQTAVFGLILVMCLAPSVAWPAPHRQRPRRPWQCHCQPTSGSYQRIAEHWPVAT